MSLLRANALQIPLADNSVQCCITSPPYWGLRDYGEKKQIGLEDSFEEFTERIVEVFREVRRVLKPDGTLWLNLGDAYATKPCAGQGKNWLPGRERPPKTTLDKRTYLPEKNLIGIPWHIAFALRADGWILRSDIIWHKRNPLPESVRDRPTKCHEYIFLLTKNPQYFYDAEAIREPVTGSAHSRGEGLNPKAVKGDSSLRTRSNSSFSSAISKVSSGNKRRRLAEEIGRPDSHLGTSIPWEGTHRNKRSVWTVNPQRTSCDHFAAFPEKLVEPMILAGSRKDDIILDPFCGTGTTGYVAASLGRKFVGLDISAKYLSFATKRLSQIQLRLTA